MREKKKDPCELQEHRTSGVQSHCKMTPPFQSFLSGGAPGNHQQNSVQVVLGSAQRLTMKYTVFLSALVSKGCKLKKHIIIIDTFSLNDYFCVWSNRELLVPTGHWKLYRSEHFSSDYGNFPLLFSKITVINLKVEGGGFSAHAKLPCPLVSVKWQEFI